MTAPEPRPPASGGSAAPSAARLHALLVFAAAIGVYLNTLAFGFVWDDVHHVLESAVIQDLANVPRMFASDVWSGSTRDVEAAPYYRPLFQVSLALDHAIWGDRPLGYHLTNVLLHAIASLLAWLLARRVLASAAGALAAGLLFAVHPVHSEAVAWISARNEALCAILALVAFRQYLRFADHGRQRDLVASLAAFFLSLLAKEMSITLPALVLLHELSLGGGRPRQAVRRAAPFALVVAAFLALRAVVLDVESWGGSPLGQRVLTSFGIVVEYMRLLVFPAGQKVFHALPVQEHLLTAGVLGPVLVLAAVGAAIALAWRVDRRAFFGLAWTVIALAPVSGIPAELAPALLAERYLYVPSIGFALAVGAGVAAAAARLAAAPSGHAGALRRGALAGGVAVLLGLALATVAQNRVWRDGETFARACVRDAPREPTGHLWLAGAHAAAGRLDEAERSYLEAIALRPRAFEARVNLANLYDQTGRAAEAEMQYLLALQLAPEHPEVLYNYAVHLLGQGRIDAAEPVLRKVVELNPASCDAHYNLALVYAERGERQKAIAHLEQAARIDPSDERFRTAMAASRGPP